MTGESRQVRRARERAVWKATFDRVHGQVLAGRTVRDMWLAFARHRFSGMDLDSPEVRQTVEASFYAGVAAMMELMNRVSPDGISEEQGVEMLTRLYEELNAYANRRVS